MEATNFSLFKLTKVNRWYVQYTDAQGVRHQKSTRCRKKTDALRRLAEFKNWIATQPRTPSITLSSFTTEYTIHINAVLQKSTARSYQLALKNFIRIIGDLPLTSLTPRHWDAFKTKRLSETKLCVRKRDRAQDDQDVYATEGTISPLTVNVELRGLRACLGTAVRWQLIPKNPFDRLPLVSIPQKRPPYLSVSEAETLLTSIKNRSLKNIVIFAINTGMRAGELCSLRHQDIDIARRIAIISNREDFRTKTGEERVVALNDTALLIAEEQKEASKGVFLFSNRSGGRLTESYISHQFKKSVRKAGLSDTLHFHSLRHTFASLLVGYGTSIYAVSKLLGHASVKTSEIYSHLLPTSLGSEVQKLGIGRDSKRLLGA